MKLVFTLFLFIFSSFTFADCSSKVSPLTLLQNAPHLEAYKDILSIFTNGHTENDSHTFGGRTLITPRHDLFVHHPHYWLSATLHDDAKKYPLIGLSVPVSNSILNEMDIKTVQQFRVWLQEALDQANAFAKKNNYHPITLREFATPTHYIKTVEGVESHFPMWEWYTAVQDPVWGQNYSQVLPTQMEFLKLLNAKLSAVTHL